MKFSHTDILLYDKIYSNINIKHIFTEGFFFRYTPRLPLNESWLYNFYVFLYPRSILNLFVFTSVFLRNLRRSVRALSAHVNHCVRVKPVQ